MTAAFEIMSEHPGDAVLCTDDDPGDLLGLDSVPLLQHANYTRRWTPDCALDVLQEGMDTLLLVPASSRAMLEAPSQLELPRLQQQQLATVYTCLQWGMSIFICTCMWLPP